MRDCVICDDSEVGFGDRYEWLSEVGWADMAVAGCLIAVAGASEVQALEAFGAEGEAAMTLEESVEDMNPSVGVIPVRSGLLVAEINGFQGSRPEVLRKAAAGGRAASVYWNVNGVIRRRLACLPHLGGLGPAALAPAKPKRSSQVGVPASGLETRLANARVHWNLVLIEPVSGP